MAKDTGTLEEPLISSQHVFRLHLAVPLIPWICLVFYSVLAVRMAWVSDDAFITMRTVANLVDGQGLVWNLGERVQTYTHPLWMLLLAAVYSVIRNPFIAILCVSLLVSLVMMVVLLFGLARTSGQAILCTVLLGFSHAFVDFSTSGLENPLSHLLIALFWLVYFRLAEKPWRLLILTLLASLGAVNRLDTLLVFAPGLLWAWWRAPQRLRTLPMLALGMLPLALWEIFSLIYYGFLFPNTAYAKLHTGISSFEFAQQGVIYLLDSIGRDPLTLLGVGCCCGLVLRRPDRHTLLPVVLGMLLYLVYVVRIGGDFMSGRFLSVPVLMAAVILSQSPVLAQPRINLAAALAVAVLGIVLPMSPWAAPVNTTPEIVGQNGIANERDFYFIDNSLVNWSRNIDIKDDRLYRPADLERMVAYSDKVMVAVYPAIGRVGFYIDRSVYIVDPLALSDPLLARLPSVFLPDWRIGHFTRTIPDGYLLTLASGTNHFADAQLGEYYAKLQLITRGPIFAPERWQAIWQMNTGALDHLIDADRYRYPHRLRFTAADARPEAHLPAQRIINTGGVLVDFPAPQTGATMELNLSHNFAYEVRYLRDGAEVARQQIGTNVVSPDPMTIFSLKVPPAAIQQGYNHIWIFPLTANDNAFFQSLRVLGADDGPTLAVHPSLGWSPSDTGLLFYSPGYIQVVSPITQVVFLRLTPTELHDPLDSSNRSYAMLHVSAMSGAEQSARVELGKQSQIPLFVGKGTYSFEMRLTTDRDHNELKDSMRVSDLSVASAQPADGAQLEHSALAGGQLIWAAGWEPVEHGNMVRWARSPASLWIYSSRSASADIRFTPAAIFDPAAPRGMGYQGSFDLASGAMLTNRSLQIGMPATYPVQLSAGWNEVVLSLRNGNFRPSAFDPGSHDRRELSFALRDLDVQISGAR